MSANEIDLSGTEFVADPYPVYRQLRDAGSPYWVAHGGHTGGMWFFTRYDHVAALLKSANTTKDVTRFAPPEAVSPLDHHMLSKDPPDHTRLRSLANQAFTPRRVRELEPRIEAIVDDLIARVRSQGGMEFMADFALPLPVTVIAELLGVPLEDRIIFHEWTNRIIIAMDAVRASEEDAKQSDAALGALARYFVGLIERRRHEPGDDLISALISARDKYDRLSEDELLAMCVLLLIAGHETTVNLLGNGLWTLLNNPAQLDHLKTHPELMPPAIEEMLRFESPVQRATFRVAIEEFEIGGITVPKGRQVSAVIGAANRDPNQFPQPDTFDITRQPNRHLAFGLGIHFCLGAPLARAEARIGFARLLEQLPHIRLTRTTADWMPSTFFRGLRALPVAF